MSVILDLIDNKKMVTKKNAPLVIGELLKEGAFNPVQIEKVQQFISTLSVFEYQYLVLIKEFSQYLKENQYNNDRYCLSFDELNNLFNKNGIQLPVNILMKLANKINVAQTRLPSGIYVGFDLFQIYSSIINGIKKHPEFLDNIIFFAKNANEINLVPDFGNLFQAKAGGLFTDRQELYLWSNKLDDSNFIDFMHEIGHASRFNFFNSYKKTLLSWLIDEAIEVLDEMYVGTKNDKTPDDFILKKIRLFHQKDIEEKYGSLPKIKKDIIVARRAKSDYLNLLLSYPYDIFDCLKELKNKGIIDNNTIVKPFLNTIDDFYHVYFDSYLFSFNLKSKRSLIVKTEKNILQKKLKSICRNSLIQNQKKILSERFIDFVYQETGYASFDGKKNIDFFNLSCLKVKKDKDLLLYYELDLRNLSSKEEKYELTKYHKADILLKHTSNPLVYHVPTEYGEFMANMLVSYFKNIGYDKLWVVNMVNANPNRDKKVKSWIDKNNCPIIMLDEDLFLFDKKHLNDFPYKEVIRREYALNKDVFDKSTFLKFERMILNHGIQLKKTKLNGFYLFYPSKTIFLDKMNTLLLKSYEIQKESLNSRSFDFSYQVSRSVKDSLNQKVRD